MSGPLLKFWNDFKKTLTIPGTVSFQDHDRVRKFACIFAGMNHMQPLLLATTNSHYLLDRFCMERCCSSEYISRIVTSLIFMEVMATLIVAPTGIYIANWQSDKATGQDLNKWNEDEEKIRGIVGSIIQLIILLGYIQILYAFTTGGKKGHMHWFYFSLLFQYFVICLISGGIGFWDGGRALWYLMAIPMGPIPVFFYQLIIHSWIRNNGPRDVEYIVVRWQIILALSLSCIATTYWIYGYLISYYPIELEIQGLGTGNLESTDRGRINAESGKAITLSLNTKQSVTKTNPSLNLGSLSGVQATVTLTSYSLALLTADSGSNHYITTTITATVNIEFKQNVQSVSVTTGVTLNTITLEHEASSNPIAKSTRSAVNITSDTTKKFVSLSLTIKDTRITFDQAITSVIVTIPVAIKVTKGGAPGQTETITSVKLKLPATAQNKLTIPTAPTYSGGTLEINVAAGRSGQAEATVNEVTGKGFAPKTDYYCFYSVVYGTNSENKKDIWANIGGKCEYVACYYKAGSKTPALLVLYVRRDDTLSMKYFGKDSGGDWKEFTSEAEFHKNLGKNITVLATANGSLTSLTGQPTDQYNREYSKVLCENWLPPSNPSQTWLPLVMQGLSVGAVGSIFPNLIPKTLVCPKTTRSLSVINMFLVPVPHVINLALADNNCNPSSKPWDGFSWQYSWLLYIFYIMAFLFAIFNVHSPEWKLCCYIRNRTWFIFLMTLFTNVLNEVFNAISRGGIMTQRSAKKGGSGQQSGQKLLNHPLLWNKMACLMSLSYLPFWMTTTPMMKSYVSSLDPFLCDKDRDHWPTARYGRLRSFGYWCKCACRGLYNSPRKLITLNMRKALTRKDPLPVAGMTTVEFY